jgi:hypothetical protein
LVCFLLLYLGSLNNWIDKKKDGSGNTKFAIVDMEIGGARVDLQVCCILSYSQIIFTDLSKIADAEPARRASRPHSSSRPSSTRTSMRSSYDGFNGKYYGHDRGGSGSSYRHGRYSK